MVWLTVRVFKKRVFHDDWMLFLPVQLHWFHVLRWGQICWDFFFRCDVMSLTRFSREKKRGREKATICHAKKIEGARTLPLVSYMLGHPLLDRSKILHSYFTWGASHHVPCPYILSPPYFQLDTIFLQMSVFTYVNTSLCHLRPEMSKKKM